MENREEQNEVEQVKETQKELKEANKLAANVASGNVLGAAKNAMNLFKSKEFKKKLKKRMIRLLLQAMIPLIIGACFFSGVMTIKDTMIDLFANAGTAISGFISELAKNVWKYLTNDYWIKLDEEMEYIIDSDTGETLGTSNSITDEDLKDENGNPRNTEKEKYTIVDKYIKELGNQGLSLKALRLLGDADYSNEEKLLEDEENRTLVEKYIAEFIRADIITQQPHKNQTADLINPGNQNWIDGGVYFYRTKKDVNIDAEDFTDGTYSDGPKVVEDQDYKLMTYMPYDKFMEKVEENDKDLRYRYTIDEDTGELIVVKIKETKTLYSKVENTGWFTSIAEWLNEKLGATTTYELEVQRIDYKEYIAKYTMPYEFLINLCEITQNPEFVYHVALLARNTKIVLGIQDNTTVDRETVEVLKTETTYKSSTYSMENASESTNEEKTRTVTITTTRTPVLKIEYADTWSFYDEFEYTRTIEGTLEEEGPFVNEYSSAVFEYPEHTEEQESYEGATITVTIPTYYEKTVTKEETATQTMTVVTEYSEPIMKKSVEKSKQFLGLLRNSTGKCDYDCSNDTVSLKYDPTALKCAKKAEFDKNGINVQYRIPNMTRTESPLNRLTSGIQILYAALQSNSSGYKEEDKLISNEQIGESYEIQDQYMADKDYESAYVVKMQGLVEHMRYLMTFPDNESYTIKDIILDFLLGNDDDDYEDIIVNEGMIASAREIYEFLIGKGFTPESACAILGNIQQESGFRTGASNGTHFGLCQWGDGRWEALRQFAEQRGTSWTDLDTQLEFLWSELCGNKTDVKNAIINSTDIYDSTDVFCREFEICGNYGIEVPRRYKYAQYWYSIFVLGNDANCAELERFFPNGIPQTEAEMQKYLVTITVPINNKDGSKGSKSVRVHKDVANDVLEIFKQIQESGFKAYDIQGYSWRSTSTGTGTRSHHSYGLAIDINVKENYCIKNGKVIAGEFWRPDKNEYSIRANGPVVKAFESRGWTWGGNWKSSKDYMHFSVTGK